jgi:hypothetical protein
MRVQIELIGAKGRESDRNFFMRRASAGRGLAAFPRRL